MHAEQQSKNKLREMSMSENVEKQASLKSV